jgi:DNA-binding beta-propeller fold protein YncE
MTKRIVYFLSAAAVAATLGVVSAQTSVPEIPFDSNPDPLTLPDGMYLGEAAGVATNSKGDIFVYTRTGNPTMTLGSSRAVSHGGSKLFQFDRNGKFVREIGQGAYGLLQAQAVRIDPQDNIWIVDQVSNQVIKFNPEGRIVSIWGRKPEALRVPAAALTPRPYGVPVDQDAAESGGAGAGRGGRGRGGLPGAGTPGENFSRPTDVAWDSAGNLYVADGLGNARIAKYEGTGRFIKAWGSRGSAEGQFDMIQGIAIDAQNNVYVADEGNKRIQVFDTEGTFKRSITGIGSPTAICITPGSSQSLYVAHTGDPDGMVDAAIYKLNLDGTIVGKFGSAGKLPKQFNLVNSIDCRVDNQLLVGELASWRVQKLTLHPAR